MFSRILIANRGEIALRIIRSCKKLGVETVLVHSEADRDSLPYQMADHHVCIGPNASAQSYLNIPSVISAAEITDVDAIHPGYGFLSENSHFADVCRGCHIEFIGPSSKSMDMMANKVEAKAMAIKANVPVVPGSDGAVETIEQALALAEDIGYPLMIKASNGGGGKGMRLVHNDNSLVSGFHAVQSEAMACFGDDELYIERFIEKPRHVEVQILADNYGTVLHLGERDCTVQRRHQKLIEESPCPTIDEKLRNEICEAGVRIAKACGYTNAGTVEFLLASDGRFYFMEMNMRIQVEHPVTEMVTGIDLIEWQIRIASGEKLTLKQEDIKFNGCAMEARINAEDPYNNFTPSPGEIKMYFKPSGDRVRIDSHVYGGYHIPPYYDSMIGKLIVHAPTREETIRKLSVALDSFIIDGIKTTIPFSKQIINHSKFQESDYDTSFIETYLLKD